MADPKFNEFKVVITSDMAGERVDRLLGAQSEVGSRSQAARLIAKGKVALNGSVEIVKSSTLLRADDVLTVQVPVTAQLALEPWDFPLKIVYEDEDVIVVDKPAGLVVHPACGHATDTLVNALVHYTKDLSQGFDELRPGLVHRLDKDTSGLIVIARNEKAQREIAMQFQRKATHRVYHAIVHGVPRRKSGTITSYLRRFETDRRRSSSVPEAELGDPPIGKRAVTHFSVKQTHKTEMSLVELRLETGRTHQIRVHMSESGHPIVGDTLYGAQKWVGRVESKELQELLRGMGRFSLHASELGFTHPRSQEFLWLKSAWPADLQRLVDALSFPSLGTGYSVKSFERRPKELRELPLVGENEDSDFSEDG